MSVAVLSSIYGGYDTLAPPPDQTVDADWILVTDRFSVVPGWRVIIEPRPHMHPRFAAKVPKCLPWLYTSAQRTVWMDGSCRLLVPDALERILDTADGSALSQIIHPWRNDILEEASASVGMPKYDDHPVLEQARHYLEAGHPRGWGLWATGLIVRSIEFRKQLDAFGSQWLIEQMRWTYQDQISEPHVLREHGLRPDTIPYALHGSGILEWLNHRDEF